MNDGVVIFSCGRQSVGPCASCGRDARARCEFELRGSKAGHRCDRPICDDCARLVQEKGGLTRRLCPPHQRARKEVEGT